MPVLRATDTNQSNIEGREAMAPRTQKQQNADDFIAVKKQVLVDKQDVLSAIDSRMAKLGTDHDLLIEIATNVSGMKGDIVKLSSCLDGKDGVISTIASNRVEIDQLRKDVDTGSRNSNIWGGGNLLVILGAFLAAWFHK
jgi:hypothetical protein